MALRALQGPTGGGAPVGGTGTTNTIPRWTGPSTLGDSGLIDDGSAVYTTTRFIGIGRSTAIGTNCRLNVQLAGSTASGYTAPSNAAALFDCGVAANGGIGLVGGGALGYYFGNASDGYDGGVEYISRILYLRGKGTRALAVDGGNVGIGTASPAGKLEVSGASDQTVWITATSAGSTTLSLYPSGGGLAQINAVGASNLAFRTNSTERARIDSSGSVCINTTNARTSRFSVEQTGTGTKLATFSNAVDADFEIKSASAGLLTIGTGTGTLAIQSGGTERMRVSNSGVASASQVAIGTSSFTSGCSLTVAQSIDVSQSAQGLKLPATPGNADTQTLDAYKENTFTATTSSATNCSSITLSNLRYTQIGRLVTIEGTASFTVTAATTATSFYFTLPSGCNRGSTANAGVGLAVDNATGYGGALWNLAGTNSDVFLFFNASNPFGAGTSRTVPFSYSYYTASS